ncbi:hypothetical protein BGW80DRAFT_70554 [Lactifluus volemus]|nr:hypothetical protein BGW80DRAFT_70554 [Lactifluus volemus]
MSSTAVALPRPILKHSSQPHPDPTDNIPPSLRLPRQCRNTVHFPPSPTLTRTFSAHSSSTYDRSPIVVLPNICALPARGCPGRTYIPGCTAPSSPNNSHALKAALKAGAGAKHIHPRRALGFGLVQESPPEHAATRPPPLVPDLSSESDESDGFTNSPSELGTSTAMTNPFALPPEEGYQHHSYEEERRRRRKRDRDHRGKGGREQCLRQRPHGRNMSTRDFERKPVDRILEEELEEDDEDRDIGECRYKSFYSGTTLRGCSLEADEDTCLGGF